MSFVLVVARISSNSLLPLFRKPHSIVAAWCVCRTGRVSYVEFEALGVVLQEIADLKAELGT